MLPANTPILSALSLPPVYAITNLQEMGEVPFFRALALQLENGLRLIQVREKQLDREAVIVFAHKIIAHARPFGAKVLMNADLDDVIKAGADGIHLSSHALMNLSEKPHDLLVAASCHNTQEMAKAVQLNLDFVMLSPVLPTRSHPETQGMGWEVFGKMKQDYPLPVYALGGMQYSELNNAWHAGGHGIAMQRAVWE
jgi:8-oxo-dGTP diphosphatase